MQFLKTNWVALVALVIAIAACFLPVLPNGKSLFGASTLGTNLVPTTLSGGSAPTVFNALEATESFISDGTEYLINGTTFYGGTTAATAAQQVTTKVPSLTAASTTPCAIQSPNATSTIETAAITESVSSTTASTIVIATAKTAFATTTLLNTVAVSAGASVTFAEVATTSTLSIIAPNNWVVFSQQGGTGTFSPTGVCTAQFLTVS